jgi:hypothetical protein
MVKIPESTPMLKLRNCEHRKPKPQTPVLSVHSHNIDYCSKLIDSFSILLYSTIRRQTSYGVKLGWIHANRSMVKCLDRDSTLYDEIKHTQLKSLALAVHDEWGSPRNGLETLVRHIYLSKRTGSMISICTASKMSTTTTPYMTFYCCYLV